MRSRTIEGFLTTKPTALEYHVAVLRLVVNRRLTFGIATVFFALWTPTAVFGAQTYPAMFRATPDRTGVFASGKPPTLAAVAWRTHVRGRIYGSPIVADGVVYVGASA